MNNKLVERKDHPRGFKKRKGHIKKTSMNAYVHLKELTKVNECIGI